MIMHNEEPLQKATEANTVKEKKTFTEMEILWFWRRVKKLRIVLKSLKEGNSILGAAKAANVNVATLWKWRQQNKNLDAKLYQIIDSRNAVMEDAHYKSGIEGNVTAQMNWLYNRVAERWADKRAVSQTNQNLNLTQNKISLEAIDESTVRRVTGNIGSLRKYGIIDAEVGPAQH